MTNSFNRDAFGRYVVAHRRLDEATILRMAEDIFARKMRRLGAVSSEQEAGNFWRYRLAGIEHEEFHVAWLDTRHRIIACERLFRGSIDGCSVYPREVVRAALSNNAAAAIFAHNHPSGNPEPSRADAEITRRLKDALALIEVRVLDHVVVAAEGITSGAARGWI